MIRWERLGALGVPVAVMVALGAIVRGVWMFGERWGWIALGVALLFLAFAADRGAAPEQPGQQAQRMGVTR